MKPTRPNPSWQAGPCWSSSPFWLSSIVLGLLALLLAAPAWAVDPTLRRPPRTIDEFETKGPGDGGGGHIHPTVALRAAAVTLSYNGTVVDGPEWVRPLGCGPTLSGLGPVRYHAQVFSVSVAGSYDLLSAQTFDGYLQLYERSFNPSPPDESRNCVASNDDGVRGIGSSELLGQALRAGTDYILVTSGFARGEVGTFTNTLRGPGVISLGGSGPDVAVVVTPSVASVGILGTFTYRIDVSNYGPDDATGVSVSAVLSPNLHLDSSTCGPFPWAVGNLAQGANAGCSVTVTLMGCGRATLAGEVDAEGVDDDSNNGSVAEVNANLLADASFEAGGPNPTWVEASTRFGSPLCTQTNCGSGTGTGSRTGAWWAWFGGTQQSEESSLRQSIIIPLAESAMLELYVEAFVCSGAPADFFEVLIDDRPVYRLDAASPLCGVRGHTLQTIDVVEFADGASHTVELRGKLASGQNSNFFVDDPAISICTGSTPEGGPFQDIPTLGEWGLALLASALGLGGLAVLRRQRRVA